MFRRSHVALGRCLSLCFGLWGCAPEGPNLGASWPTDGAAPTILIHDFHGDPQQPNALPHWPVIILDGWVLTTTHEPPLWLLAGTPTPELLKDLERKPLTQARQGQAVTVELDTLDGHPALVAQQALQEDSPYTLAIGGWLPLAREQRGRIPLPLAIELHSAGALGGARLLASLPAAGQADAPPDLTRILLAFRGRLDTCGALSLQGKRQATLQADALEIDCHSVHTPADSCCEILPAHALDRGADYLVSLALARDLHGGPVEAEPIDFRTRAGAAGATPELVELACATDERALAPGLCGLVGDSTFRLRLRADQPVHAELELGGQTRSWLAGRAEATIRWEGLRADHEYVFALTLRTASGLERRYQARFTTPLPLAQVTITEVRADPLGQEPIQEYVELWNYGPTAASIDGFTLADRETRGGMLIGSPAPLQPGERVLLVADGFDPESTLDASPPPGTRLVRIGSALASRGLSNAGEPLFLRDRRGRRLSASPSTPRPKPGSCNVRISDDPRSGEPGAFVRASECTPGR